MGGAVNPPVRSEAELGGRDKLSSVRVQSGIRNGNSKQTVAARGYGSTQLRLPHVAMRGKNRGSRSKIS